MTLVAVLLSKVFSAKLLQAASPHCPWRRLLEGGAGVLPAAPHVAPFSMKASLCVAVLQQYLQNVSKSGIVMEIPCSPIVIVTDLDFGLISFHLNSFF